MENLRSWISVVVLATAFGTILTADPYNKLSDSAPFVNKENDFVSPYGAGSDSEAFVNAGGNRGYRGPGSDKSGYRGSGSRGGGGGDDAGSYGGRNDDLNDDSGSYGGGGNDDASYGGYKGSSQCNCLRWTNWINADTPGDSGDWETVGPPDDKGRPGTIHHVRPDICTIPVRMECRTVHDKKSWYLSYERITHGCNAGNRGFACENKKQGYGKCKDYESRVLCFYPGKECDCLYWTKWYDNDDPTYKGDDELIGRSLPTYVCDNGYEPVDVQCKTTAGIDVFHAGNKNVQCDLQGLSCNNYDQGKNCKCHDYQVRFLCPRYPNSFPILEYDPNFQYNGQNSSSYAGNGNGNDYGNSDYNRNGEHGERGESGYRKYIDVYGGGNAVSGDSGDYAARKSGGNDAGSDGGRRNSYDSNYAGSKSSDRNRYDGNNNQRYRGGKGNDAYDADSSDSGSYAKGNSNQNDYSGGNSNQNAYGGGGSNDGNYGSDKSDDVDIKGDFAKTQGGGYGSNDDEFGGVNDNTSGYKRVPSINGATSAYVKKDIRDSIYGDVKDNSAYGGADESYNSGSAGGNDNSDAGEAQYGDGKAQVDYGKGSSGDDESNGQYSKGPYAFRGGSDYNNDGYSSKQDQNDAYRGYGNRDNDDRQSSGYRGGSSDDQSGGYGGRRDRNQYGYSGRRSNDGSGRRNSGLYGDSNVYDGQNRYGGGGSYGGYDKKSQYGNRYGNDRSNSGNDRYNDRSNYGRDRYDNDRSGYGNDRYDNDRSNYGNDRYDNDRSNYGNDRYDNDRSIYSNDGYDNDRSGYGNDRQYGDDSESYGYGEGSFGYGGRKNQYGGDSYGNRNQDSSPEGDNAKSGGNSNDNEDYVASTKDIDAISADLGNKEGYDQEGYDKSVTKDEEVYDASISVDSTKDEAYGGGDNDDSAKDDSHDRIPVLDSRPSYGSNSGDGNYGGGSDRRNQRNQGKNRGGGYGAAFASKERFKEGVEAASVNYAADYSLQHDGDKPYSSDSNANSQKQYNANNDYDRSYNDDPSAQE